jgi:hypothetical protein
MFGKDAFIRGLQELGYAAESLEGNRIAFQYSIKDGRFRDRAIRVGIEVPADFNVTCPTGPHILPGLIPMNPQGSGNDRAATSPFGVEWQYLSRPFRDQQQGWNRTSRDVKAYLHHLRQIFETL